MFHWLVVSSCGRYSFWTVAVIVSALYGKFCWTINELDWDEKLEERDTTRWDKGTNAWKLHQIWLNFLGSFAGWWACWCFLLSYESHRRWQTSFTFVDLLLAVIAFIGMTGYLPHVSRYGSKLFPLKKNE